MNYTTISLVQQVRKVLDFFDGAAVESKDRDIFEVSPELLEELEELNRVIEEYEDELVNPGFSVFTNEDTESLED